MKVDSDRIICPSCEGKGSYMAHFNMGRNGCQWRKATCFRCGGDTTIHRDKDLWIAEGQRLRDRRKSHNHSLEEEAYLRGLTPQELSRMEWGRAKPYTLE